MQIENLRNQVSLQENARQYYFHLFVFLLLPIILANILDTTSFLGIAITSAGFMTIGLMAFASVYGMKIGKVPGLRKFVNQVWAISGASLIIFIICVGLHAYNG